jgi:hypothetical protein
LKSVLESEKSFFKNTDFVYISDGSAYVSLKPGTAFGTRGVLGMNLKLTFSNADRHSDNFENLQPNPVFVMLRIIQTMFDNNNMCLIKDFYTDVRNPDPGDIEALRTIDFDE